MPLLDALVNNSLRKTVSSPFVMESALAMRGMSGTTRESYSIKTRSISLSRCGGTK